MQIAVQKRSIGSSKNGLGPDSVLLYTSNDIRRSETRSVVLNSAFLVILLFTYVAKRFVKMSSSNFTATSVGNKKFKMS